MTRSSNPVRRLKATYIFALVLVATLAVTGHLVLDRMMAGLETDAESVNLAGRQRMLSERLARLGHELVDRAGGFGHDAVHVRAREVEAELLRVHEAMRPKLETLGDPRFLDGHVEPLAASFERLARNPRGLTSLESLQVAQAGFLARQEGIVQALEEASEARVERSRSTLSALLYATLITLALEALFVFEPALGSLRRTLAARRRVYTQLRDQLELDELTGLANRRRLMRDLEERDRAHPPAQRALAFFDFDGFKAVNDSLGHDAGDALLRSMAGRLQSACGRGDLVRAYRLSGDEFVLLLDASDVAEWAESFVQDVLGRLGEPHLLQGRRTVTAASAGLSVHVDRSFPGERMLYEADAAMRVSKRSGKGRCTVYDERMLHDDERRLGIERDLPGAMEADEIALRYQVVRRLSDGESIGVEALLHWTHPTLGEIDNRELVAVANASELIDRLGCHVLSIACAELARARSGGAPPLELYVNVHPAELRSPGYPERVRAILRATGLPAASLHLECSGGMPQRGAAEYIAAMRALTALGIVTGFDDIDRQTFSLRSLTDSPARFVKPSPRPDRRRARARFLRPLLRCVGDARHGQGHRDGAGARARHARGIPCRAGLRDRASGTDRTGSGESRPARTDPPHRHRRLTRGDAAAGPGRRAGAPAVFRSFGMPRRRVRGSCTSPGGNVASSTGTWS